MRRGSLVAPLILILIGVLFLINNLKPDLPVLQIVGDYWPFLLIGWGFLRLAEVLVWNAQGKPLPRAGISGGEWTLILLIVFVGSSIFYARRVSSNWPMGRIRVGGLEVFGETFDFPLEGKLASGKTPRIVIENLRGNARVIGAEADEVKVTGKKVIRAFDRAAAKSTHEMTPFEVVAQGDQIFIRTHQERGSDNQRISADLEITVPKGATIEGRGRYGDFDINDIAGGVEIVSDNAGVRVNNIGGNVRIELQRSDIVRAVGVKGNVDIKGRGQDLELENIEGAVQFNASYYGDLTFRNLARPIRFTSQTSEISIEKLPGELRLSRGDLTANNFTGPLVLKSKSKDVVLTDFSGAVDVQLERGDIEMRPGRPTLTRIDARTRGGNIEVALPEKLKFDLSAKTLKGQVDNSYGDALKESSEGRESLLRSVATGGVPVSIQTDRGDITVRKTGEEFTAAPPLKTAPPKPLPPVAPPKPPTDYQ
jgi:DUF4097 and DUF4098 domain-containing protein YvlB